MAKCAGFAGAKARLREALARRPRPSHVGVRARQWTRSGAHLGHTRTLSDGKPGQPATGNQTADPRMWELVR